MTKLKVISIHRTGNGKPFGIFTNPRMMNSDQEYQFTSQWYIDFVKKNGIHRSMDEKSRCIVAQLSRQKSKIFIMN